MTLRASALSIFFLFFSNLSLICQDYESALAEDGKTSTTGLFSKLFELTTTDWALIILGLVNLSILLAALKENLAKAKSSPKAS